MSNCEECPVIVDIIKKHKDLEDSHYRLEGKVGQIIGETKENEKAITRLSMNLLNYTSEAQANNKILLNSVESLSISLNKHMEDETKTIDEVKEHITGMLEPIQEKMKDFDGIKIRNGIMWSIGVSVATGILGFGIYIAQQKYDEFKELQKIQYTDKEKADYAEFKRQQMLKRIKEE